MERSYQAFVGGGTGEYLGMQVGGYGGFKKYYFHNDERGSLLALSDDTGATLNGYTYDGFGNYLTSDNNDYPIEYGINGKFCDIGLRRSKFDETVADYDTRTGCGLYYFGARWYDFERGRWVSHEPLGYAGGSNLHQFNQNNPYTFVDPNGLWNIWAPWTWGQASPYGGSHWNPLAEESTSGWGGFVDVSAEENLRTGMAAADGLIPFFDPFSSLYVCQRGA